MKRPVIILLHLGYWLMFLFLLLCFFLLSLPMLDNFHKIPLTVVLSRWTYLMIGFAIIPGVISFYIFYHFLFSRFLQKGKILLLCLSGLVVSIVGAVIGGLALSFVLFWPRYMFAGGWASAGGEIAVMSFGALINGIIGLVMRGFISWYGDIKLKAELAQKNFEMELALVKSQINPHFLFNTINNIDVLIEKDPAKASGYLNKLSGIMRFMLYETKTEEIPLAKELIYIEKYIELQKIRTANEHYVQYQTTGDPAGHVIAPMLFIPFVENAFKHAESKKKENAISIRILIEKDACTFECENMYATLTEDGLGNGGLGNDLIQKRLNLLYPGRHKLEIKNENNIYKVKLQVYYHAH